MPHLEEEEEGGVEWAEVGDAVAELALLWSCGHKKGISGHTYKAMDHTLSKRPAEECRQVAG